MISAGEIEEIHRVLESEFGWSFPDDRWREVEEASLAVAQEAGMADLATLARSLAQNGTARRSVLDLLTRRLSVNETSFFRHQQIFRLLEEQIFPRLIQRRAGAGRRLRIWSAGCCSGEETYSLAIALGRCLPVGEAWDIQLVGTDLNEASIQCAEAGIYNAWAFRGAPRWLQETCFTRLASGQYEIHPELRGKARFLTHNLMNGLPSLFQGGKIDLLFCRNVLMYFSTEKSARLVEVLRSSLAEDGFLCVAPYESLRLKGSQLEPADPFANAFFRRRPASPVVPAAPARVRKEPRCVTIGRWARNTPQRPRVGRGRPERRWVVPASAPAPRLDVAEDRFREIRQLAGRGRLWEALEACETLVDANRLDPEVYYLRATILQEGGLVSEALKALRQTLYLEPEFILAHLALATHARSEGRTAEADRSVGRACQLLSMRPPSEIVPASEGMTAAAILGLLQGREAGR